MHGYELNALTPAETERFELHLFQCEECCRQLRDFYANARELRVNPEIRELIGRGASESEPSRVSIWHKVWPDGPLLLKPAVIYALLLLVLVPFVFTMSNDRPRIKSDVQMIVVSSIRSASTPQLQASLGTDGIVSFVFPEANSNRHYCLTILDSGEKEIFVDSTFTNLDAFGNGTIVFPAEAMIPGKYTITVHDCANRTPDTGMIYRFSIVE